MDVRMCREPRALGIYLLGLAASFSVFASVSLFASVPHRIAPGQATPIAAAPLPTGPIAAVATQGPILAAATRGLPPHPFQTLRSELTPPSDSIGHRYTRRTFVEDTTPPSSSALKAVRLQIPARPQTTTPAPAPARRNLIASPSNRQRAP
jgi:hypothetical protein